MPKRAPIFRPFGRTREQQTQALRQETDDRRGSSTARGYGSDWQRVRLAHLQSEPLCRFCSERGEVVPATVVDHVKSIVEAPHLRLDHSNLRSLCKRCHDSRTGRDQGFGRRRRGGGGEKV